MAKRKMKLTKEMKEALLAEKIVYGRKKKKRKKKILSPKNEIGEALYSELSKKFGDTRLKRVFRRISPILKKTPKIKKAKNKLYKISDDLIKVGKISKTFQDKQIFRGKNKGKFKRLITYYDENGDEILSRFEIVNRAKHTRDIRKRERDAVFQKVNELYGIKRKDFDEMIKRVRESERKRIKRFMKSKKFKKMPLKKRRSISVRRSMYYAERSLYKLLHIKDSKS